MYKSFQGGDRYSRILNNIEVQHPITSLIDNQKGEEDHV